MKVADSAIVTPTAVTPTAVPPVIPVAAEAVRPILDGSKASRDRRDTAEQQQGKGTSFRAALDAATVGGLGEAFTALGSSTSRSSTSRSSEAPRLERRPTGRLELDAAEADGLYRAAQVRATSSGDAGRAREYFAASRQYAQRFFSVGGTHAARGESLELRA